MFATPAPLADAHLATLDQLEQRLLHAFAGDVAHRRAAPATPCQLVHLVDIDDAPLRLLHIATGGFQQAGYDAVNVVADVAGLGQGGGIGGGEGHAEDARQGAHQQGLAGARRAGHEDVGLLQLDRAAQLADRLAGAVEQAQVVVVDRHRQGFLGLVLADHRLVQMLHVGRRREQLRRQLLGLAPLPPAGHHLVGQLDAGLADPAFVTRDQGYRR